MTPERFLRIDQVLDRSGHSKTTLYEAIKRGDYPAPVKRGRTSLWIESEIDEAIAREAQRLLQARGSASHARAA